MTTRQIVFDTETTGVSISSGDRIIEIGCVELINMVPTGEIFHTYVNPCKEVSQGAFNVHGLSNNFLKQFPTFDKICENFLNFIKNDELIAHNAQFDINFVNNELNIMEKSLLTNQVVDTLDLARKKFPGSRVSLDALCDKFNINSSMRTKHGALLDAELLSQVYIELNGGRQQSIFSKNTKDEQISKEQSDISEIETNNLKLMEITLTDEELDEHSSFISRILKNSRW